MVEHLALLWGEDLLVLKVELPFLTLDNTLCIIFARNFLAYCVLQAHEFLRETQNNLQEQALF